MLFPTLPEDLRLARLAPWGDRSRRPSVVIDTDAANEIDDQFALAWALLARERLDVQALLAAPFSFAHRRAALQALRGWDDATAAAMPAFAPPGDGMWRSLDEIRRIGALTGLAEAELDQLACAGATRYLDPRQPERTAAVDRLIALAEAADDATPLYVLVLGCPTNIAAALLLAPELVRRLVVVWTAGFPSHAPQPNRAFNLEQDLAATRVLLGSGVPLVYLPGFHIGAQLRLSAADAERALPGRGGAGGLGDALFELFMHNPLWPLTGTTGVHDRPAYSWVIWDLICVAWLLDPAWVPTDLVRTPGLGDDLRWQPGDADRPWMREAWAVDRDAIFGDLFSRLDALPR
ncbi:nucleoside hydrolase [Rubrivivax albus]|uniref:Inosine/uridine-preferring nucleoside hydrolase domain-containing protein n=1 Tax=Rubrivivax albus TaxID=2499835 RepID=A0A3S2WYU5_9BURK|nr:nucleoside hydrolase [Rubrivivax albus]RVT49363.1 hypothetical protein ENE75_20000 [Rubrivivax albus]